MMAVLRPLAAVVALCAAALAAEAPYTPPSGSAERAAILDAMRAKGEDRARIFVVRHLKVADGWAWLGVDPRSRTGSDRYEPESALLHRGPSGWRVIDQLCAEEGCREDQGRARIRQAHPEASAALFRR